MRCVDRDRLGSAVASPRRLVALCMALAGCVALACGETGTATQPQGAAPAPSAADPKAAPPVVTPETGAPPAVPGVTADGSIVSAVTWFPGTLEAALAEATRTGKLVFVDVGAYWCPPCHRLDEEVFTQQEVGEAIGAGYVAVHIDAEKGEGPEVVARYKVQAYPTMLVLEATGAEKGRLVDFLPPDAFLLALQRLADGGNVLAALQAAAEAAPDDLEKQYAWGHALALAARREAAVQVFDALLVADPKNELGWASKVQYDRALFITNKLDGETDAAIAAFRALQARYPETREAVWAYAKIGRLLNEQGRADEAIEALDAMLATDPDDVALYESYGWFSFREHCQPARGLAVVQAGLVRHPTSADLHYLAAELRSATGDPTGALAAIQQASALEPDSAYYKRQVRRFASPTGESDTQGAVH